MRLGYRGGGSPSGSLTRLHRSRPSTTSRRSGSPGAGGLRQAREPPRSRVRREPESAGASRRGTMGCPGPSALVVGTSPHRRERKEAGKLTVMVAHPPLEERSLEESTWLLLP